MPSNLHPIWRCKECGNKTHHRFWLGGKCPVCETASSYVESRHGGLSLEEIAEAKANILKVERSLGSRQERIG